MINEDSNLHVSWFATIAALETLETSKCTGWNQISDHFALGHSDGSKGHGKLQDCIGCSLGGNLFTMVRQDWQSS